MVTDLQLKEFAQANPHLVSHRASKRYPDLSVLKYKHKVFYDNLWTPELQEMRGLVVDRDWNVVVRPFTKIFNRFENGTDFDLNWNVVAVQKLNGFLGCITNTEKYGLIVSTTGSLDSDFVALAEKYLRKLEPRGLCYDCTYMFEICDSSDPHIVEEKEGAYLIGVRSVRTGFSSEEEDLDAIAQGLGVMRPHWKLATFGEIVEETRSCKHEGFVVHDGMGNSLKIKSPYYLTKKFFARVKPEKLTPNWLEQNRGNFDEEFYGLIDHISAHRDEFTAMDQEGRKVFIEEYLNG